MKKISVIKLLAIWTSFCVASVVLFFAVAHAQTTSEKLTNPVVDPTRDYRGEYDMLRGFTRYDELLGNEPCNVSGVGTCSDAALMRMRNPRVSGGVFSFDVEVKAANPPGASGVAIMDPGATSEDRTKLGNIICDCLAIYLTYGPGSLGGTNRFASACSSSNGDLLSVGFPSVVQGNPNPAEADNQGDVGAYTWSNSGAAGGPAAPIFNLVTLQAEPLKQIPHENFGSLATVSCNLTASAIDENTLAQASFHALSYNTFNQLTASGLTEAYAVAAVNDLLNYPLDGTGLYMADAKFGGDNGSVYLYIASADGTAIPASLTLGDFALQGGGESYGFSEAISLGTDDLDRSVFLLRMEHRGSVTESVQASLTAGDTDAADYAYSLENSGSLFSPATQTRTLYPHHPDKPFIESIAVGANSVHVDVTFSDDVFTNRDGTGDLTQADFDVIFHGSQQGSVSGITKQSDSVYRLAISGVNSGAVGASDYVEVRSAESAEDLGYKSLKTIYINPTDASISTGRQGVYALQGAIAGLRGTLRFTATFSPNPATENTDGTIAVSVGRAGDSIGVLAYTNIALSCGGKAGTADSNNQDGRLTGILTTSVNIPEGQNQASVGNLTFANNEDSDGTISCVITANVDGASDLTTLEGTLTLRDDDNAPITVMPSELSVAFSESDGFAVLDATATLNDADGPAGQGNTPGGSNPADTISSLMVAVSIDGKDNENLGLRISESDTAPEPSLSFGSGSKSAGQAWLRTIEVVTIEGTVPPASAEVTVTIVSVADGTPFGNEMAKYRISVWKESRVGQGLVADDLELAIIGVAEADATSTQVVQSAVASYCGGGYYEDTDNDGVPNNVEVAIGTDCTVAHETDFVGGGRPALTVKSAPYAIPAFSEAPTDLVDMQVECSDPDSSTDDGMCEAVVAYVVGTSNVCTASEVGGNHESQCDGAFSSEDGFYTASPGLVDVVWLGVGSDGDWAHSTVVRTDTIALQSNQYYLAPVVSLQFSNARAGANGWVYQAESSVEVNVALPPTHSNASQFTLDVLANDMAVSSVPDLTNELVRNGTVVSVNAGTAPAATMLDEEIKVNLGPNTRLQIATTKSWDFDAQGPLYSSLSLNHITQAAGITAEALEPVIGATLSCGGEETSFYQVGSNCAVEFTSNVTQWSYRVRSYALAEGENLVLEGESTPSQDTSSLALPSFAAPITGSTIVSEVLDVIAVVEVTVEDAPVMYQRTFSFPIVSPPSQTVDDADNDGIEDDGTIGDAAGYLNRDTSSQTVSPNSFLAVGGNYLLSLGPHAYSSNFNYDTGADISITRGNSAILRTAMDQLSGNDVPGVGVYDFYVKSDVAFDGQPVRVSIPLRRGVPADGATYQIYDGSNWNAHSAVYSAPQPCPPVPAPGPVGEGSGWSDGLTPGHSCVLVELTDDCSADGGAAGNGDTTPGCGTISDIATLVTGAAGARRGGGGGSMGWMLLSGLLIAMLVSYIPLMRRKKQGDSN